LRQQEIRYILYLLSLKIGYPLYASLAKQWHPSAYEGLHNYFREIDNIQKHNFILYNALTNRDSPNFPLPSNPLPQIVTSNPRLQPDTHFAVDMFPYKTTELFQELGFYSQLPKKPGNTPLSGT